MKLHIRWLFLSLLAGGVGATACGDDTTSTAGAGADEPTGCIDYAAVPSESCCSGGFEGDGSCQGNLEVCSFSNHIVPLMQRSCSLSVSCHTGSSPKEELYLGPTFSVTPDQAEIDTIYGNIIDAPSNQSNLVLVEAGNPGGSYLLAKTEYKDFSVCGAITCTGSDEAPACGERMPQASLKLEAYDRAQFAAWIADGAENN